MLQVRIRVQLERKSEAGAVLAPRFPAEKQEFWWLIVGDEDGDAVLAIKRLTCDARHQATLAVDLPVDGERPQKLPYKLSFLCDSYLGCDQEYAFALQLSDDGGAAAMDEDA